MLAPLLNNFSLATMRLICSSFQFAFWHIGFWWVLFLYTSMQHPCSRHSGNPCCGLPLFPGNDQLRWHSNGGCSIWCRQAPPGQDAAGNSWQSIHFNPTGFKPTEKLKEITICTSYSQNYREGVGNTRSVGWNTSFWQTGRRMKWPHSAPKDCPSLANTLRKITHVCKYSIQ